MEIFTQSLPPTTSILVAIKHAKEKLDHLGYNLSLSISANPCD